MAHSEGLGWILSHAVLLFLTYLKAESVGPFWPCGFLRNDLSNRGKRLLAFQHACEKCCMARAPALGERPCPGGCTQATEAPRRQPRGATYSPEVSPGLTLWSHCISHGFSGGIFCPRLSMCSVFMLSREHMLQHTIWSLHVSPAAVIEKPACLAATSAHSPFGLLLRLSVFQHQWL